ECVEGIVFFFRAEDGIRDLIVTGVQTCALPISKRLKQLREETGATAICGYRRSVDWYESAGFDIMLLSALADATDGDRQTVAARSEERRVGKEGTSRQVAEQSRRIHGRRGEDET